MPTPCQRRPVLYYVQIQNAVDYSNTHTTVRPQAHKRYCHAWQRSKIEESLSIQIHIYTEKHVHIQENTTPSNTRNFWQENIVSFCKAYAFLMAITFCSRRVVVRKGTPEARALEVSMPNTRCVLIPSADLLAKTLDKTRIRNSKSSPPASFVPLY